MFGYLEMVHPVSEEVIRFPAKPHTSDLKVGEFCELVERTLELAAFEGVILTAPSEYLRQVKAMARKVEREARQARKVGSMRLEDLQATHDAVKPLRPEYTVLWNGTRDSASGTPYLASRTRRRLILGAPPCVEPVAKFRLELRSAHRRHAVDAWPDDDPRAHRTPSRLTRRGEAVWPITW